jgi:hypothetical protein
MRAGEIKNVSGEIQIGIILSFAMAGRSKRLEVRHRRAVLQKMVLIYKPQPC